MLVSKINYGWKGKWLKNICFATTTTEYSSGHLSLLDAFTRELWCEIKNIFPLDRSTIWSCILLDFGEMYHDFPSSKMFEILWKLWNWESGRPALIINRSQCWLNNSDTEERIGSKKIVILYIIFFHKSTPAKPKLVLMGNKLIFVWNGPKVYRWAKKGPKLSKSSRFTI